MTEIEPQQWRGLTDRRQGMFSVGRRRAENVTVTECAAIQGHEALTAFWVFIQFGRAGSGGIAVGGTVPVCR